MFGDYSCFPPNFLYSMCKGQLHIRDMYWFLRILSFGMLFLLYREHIYTGVTMVTKKHALWGSIKASFPVILLCTVDVSHQSFQFRQLKRDYLWLRRAQPFSSHLQNPDFFFSDQRCHYLPTPKWISWFPAMRVHQSLILYLLCLSCGIILRYGF